KLCVCCLVLYITLTMLGLIRLETSVMGAAGVAMLAWSSFCNWAATWLINAVLINGSSHWTLTMISWSLNCNNCAASARRSVSVGWSCVRTAWIPYCRTVSAIWVLSVATQT